MDEIQKRLLKEVADLDALPVGAYNIRPQTVLFCCIPSYPPSESTVLSLASLICVRFELQTHFKIVIAKFSYHFHTSVFF